MSFQAVEFKERNFLELLNNNLNLIKPSNIKDDPYL